MKVHGKHRIRWHLLDEREILWARLCQGSHKRARSDRLCLPSIPCVCGHGLSSIQLRCIFSILKQTYVTECINTHTAVNRMEIAFHRNKCALKDSLRIIRIGKNPCWKRRKDLFSYAEGLISANKNIISLNAGIPEQAQSEFSALEEQFGSLWSTETNADEVCLVCLKNCLEEEREAVLLREDEIVHIDTREERIAEVSDRMERLNNKTEFIESIINMQKEELDRIAYTTASVEYSEVYLRELEETIKRKKRMLFIKRWLSGIAVFFCFLSLLLLRPFIV
ncbi:uncharacterized protein NEMAJ01_1685 [Nematocida major]|uniref:uncharacterized protein n=1 Tax=Nematocida major TaxID=1912982 RepID=UPI0020088EDE|nr:uncharacterized protein NEMAJ01_1685 [Nematocida major]KAH9386789.1 hypothetical protein NEMAJ01_1685 [Nematocida major]